MADLRFAAPNPENWFSSLTKKRCSVSWPLPTSGYRLF
jgi:hypothetical protein